MKHEVVYIQDDDALFHFLKDTLSNTFGNDERIAIKMHMGEPGNVYFIDPSFTKRIVEILQESGCRPFIFDTPVVYSSPRNNAEDYLKVAAQHGFTEKALDVPVIISDLSRAAQGMLMRYHLAAETLDADGVLLLTHVKGHIACGMGGAIKNVGMGCMAKKTKGAIHEGGEPYYTEGCTQCGACVENCPTKNIEIDGDLPRFGCTWCSGCSNCAIVCPENCIHPNVGLFDELLSEAAVLAHTRFKKVYAINVLRNITKLCDCIANSGPIILKDVGYLCGKDMLSVDIASLEMIKRESGNEDLFASYNMRSPWGHVRGAARLMERDTEVDIMEYM